MNRDKQIEEMAKNIFEHCSAGLVEDEAKAIAHFVIERQGYRKSTDLAREIFEEIENRAYGFGACFVEMTRTTFDEIKKKYMEENL